MKNSKRLLSLFVTMALLVGLGTGHIPQVRSASNTTQEFVDAFLAECLAKLGRGYSPDNEGGGHSWTPDVGRYNCSGLVASSLEALGMPCPGLQQDARWDWDVWGKTADWKSWFSSKSNGQTVSFTLANGNTVQYTVRKPTSSTPYLTYDSNGNWNGYTTEGLKYLSIPGTIIIKMNSSQSSGHMTVSLGQYQVSGISLSGNASAIASRIPRIEDHVRQSLTARYSDGVKASTYASSPYCLSKSLSQLLAEGGTKNVYGHEAVWEYRTRSDFASKTVYNPIWQIDSLNTTAGVTVNNNPYGKDTTGAIYGLLVPDVPTQNLYGSVAVKKVDSFGNTLSGIQFGLFSYNDGAYTIVRNAFTGADGTVTFDGEGLKLKQGETYYVKELSGKHGYHTDLQTYKPVTIGPGTTFVGVDSVWVNDNWTGSLEITKTSTGSSTPLSGAEFTVYQYDATTNSYSKYAIMPYEDGIYCIPDLPYTETNQGKYRVVETAPPPGFELVENGWSRDFTIGAADQAFSYSVENAPAKGKVIVKKLAR